MVAAWAVRHRRLAWLLGGGVLLALAVTVTAVLSRPSRRPVAVAPGNDVRQLLKLEALPKEVPVQVAAGATAEPTHVVRGVVRLPDGTPAASASVVLHRAITAWPEWRGERLDQAITGRDGTFQFRASMPYGLFVTVEHPDFAGGASEVPSGGEPVQFDLAPGHELTGYVTNALGAPVANARIALEAVPGSSRRVEVATTSANGRYRFTNLVAGPVRLVARHESWQPASVGAIVVGDQVNADIRLERAAMTPLRGRVTSAASQAPVAGATVQLIPLNQNLGFVDPLTTRTGADGSFLVTGVPRGSMKLVVRHPDYGVWPRTQPVGVLATELPIELPPRTRLQGQLVVDRPPTLYRGGEVLEARDSGGGLAFAVVGPDGRFEFAHSLAPGSVSVRVLDGPFAFQRTQTTEIQLRLGEDPVNETEIVVVRPTVVRGRFVDERGAALAGVQVIRTRMLAESALDLRDAAFDLDLSAVGNQVVRLFGADRDEPLAVADSEGRFEIRGERPGGLLVRTARRGHGSRLLRLRILPTTEPVDIGVVPLPPGLRLLGRVVRGERGIVGASVTLLGRESQSTLVTDRDGRWVADDLLPGNYRVRARVPSGAIEREVTLVPGRLPPPIVLPFDTSRLLRGKVTSGDGRPLAGALVAARGVVGAAATTDEAGEFVLELPKRAVEVQAVLADRSRSRAIAVSPSAERTAIQLDTPPLCTIVARVLGLPGQQLVPGCLVRLTPLVGPETGQRRTRWVDMVDGELRWRTCPAGRVRIEIAAEGYAPLALERDFAVNEEHELGDLFLEPGCRVQLLVVDDQGVPVPNAAAWLGEEGDLDLFEPRTRTGADGNCRLGGVTSRSSQLVVRAPGFAPQMLEVQLPLDVLGSSPLRVPLQRGSTIQVTLVGGAREGGSVQLRRDGRLLATASLDDSGHAWFVNRAAGDYAVQLVGSELAPKVVTVAPDVPLVRALLP
jgi:hypothetical protein